MKRILAIVMALMLAISLCGCAELENLKNVELPPLPDSDAQAAQAAEVIPTEDIDTSGSLAQSTLPNHVIVSMEGFSEQYFDPQNNEQLILTFSYETPSVYIEGRDAAMNTINEYVATLDETYYTGNDYGVTSKYDILDGGISGVNAMLEAAIDNYSYSVESGAGDIPLEFSSERTARVERIDISVLSLVYSTYTYTGGAHGRYTQAEYSFDTESGERLTLDTLSADAAGLKAFLADYLVALYNADEDGYYSARVYEDLMADADNNPVAELVREGAWYFNNEGMVFSALPNELGPYASGIIEFTVPYDALAEHIDGKYLPPLHETAAGALTVKAQSAVEDGSVEIIDKVTVDPESEELCLFAEGTLYDLRLSTVEYSDKFYETAQLWACSYMNDCALQLETLVPDGMPKVMISWRDADGTGHAKLVTQSGETGEYILVDDDIEAVG